MARKHDLAAEFTGFLRYLATWKHVLTRLAGSRNFRMVAVATPFSLPSHEYL